MRITGFSDVMGSWNTIDICVPQYDRSAASSRPSMRSPWNVTSPERSAVDGRRPMIERDSTDLPQPDSPTSPSVRPRSSVNETPSTAVTTPRGVRNCVRRSATSSSPRPPTWKPSAVVWTCRR